MPVLLNESLSLRELVARAQLDQLVGGVGEHSLGALATGLSAVRSALLIVDPRFARDGAHLEGETS